MKIKIKLVRFRMRMRARYHDQSVQTDAYEESDESDEESVESVESISECPVCYNNFTIHEMLQCSSGHKVCFSCSSKITKPHLKLCHSECLGISMDCPLCRSTMCVRKFQLLSMATGSYLTAIQKFDQHQCDFVTWRENRVE